MASSLFAQQRSNTAQTLFDAMRAGKQPQEVLPQLAKTDPAVDKALQILRGNRAEVVTGMINQMAHNKGLTIQQILQRMGFTQ